MSDWTTKELTTLKSKASQGAQAVADELGRTVREVQGAAYRYKISLRRAGERRGVVLGQPRGVSWRAQLERTGIDVAEMPALVASIRRTLDPDSPLCPSCGRNKVQVSSTGLCEPCHWKHLAQCRREREEAKQAHTEYLRESKAALRRVECEGCGESYSPRLDREGRKSDRRLCPKCRGEA